MYLAANEEQWERVCSAADVAPFIGVRALIGRRQIAIFRVGRALYAIDAVDPFSRAAVLARGLVGDLQGQVVVASPVYKHHFSLSTGRCLENAAVCLATYPIRERHGAIEIDCLAKLALPEMESCVA